jgi:hypothetical protein
LPPEEPKKTISKKDAVEALWRKSVLYWKLDSNQQEMYNFVVKGTHKITVIGASRQLGKSYAMVVLAIEQCLKQPNAIVKFIAPKAKDIRRIIKPLVTEITADCPKDLKPEFSTQDQVFKFHNGSEIQLAGTDNGHAESIRGNKAHLCIVDEAGFCDDLDYIVNSILIPTTTTTRGKIVLASTPSKAADHPFMTFLKHAESEGRFIKKTIYQNPRLNADDIALIANSLPGGITGTDFKREYLVEMITSEEDAVVPEFNATIESLIVREWIKPPYSDSFEAMDIGGSDLTVVLFAYYDFVNGKIIVEDEIVLSGKKMLTDSLALQIKEKEVKLWSHPQTGEVKQPLLRVSDNNNIILLNDLAIKHQLNFMPTLKDNADAQLNNMRMLIRSEKIIIHPRCKTLIFHLRSATWNKSRTSYIRSADQGHYDAVDALKYLCRNIDMKKNPYPANYHLANHHASVFTNINPKDAVTELEHKLKDVFKIGNYKKKHRF